MIPSYVKCPYRMYLWKVRNAAIVILILGLLLGYTSLSTLSLRKQLRLCEMSCSMSRIQE